MRRRALLLVAILVVGACAPEFRDGRQVEGVWVGATSWTAADCAEGERCEEMVEVATAQLGARVPGARVREVRFFDLPHVADDGASVATTVQTYQIVFTLEDGSERIEHFACDMHGGLMGGIGNPAYAGFCPAPTTGE